MTNSSTGSRSHATARSWLSHRAPQKDIVAAATSFRTWPAVGVRNTAPKPVVYGIVFVSAFQNKIYGILPQQIIIIAINKKT